MKPDKKLKWATTVNKTLLMLIERVETLESLLHVLEVKMRLQPEPAVDLVKRVERLENALHSYVVIKGGKAWTAYEHCGKSVGKSRGRKK